MQNGRSIVILLVEDNLGDARLVLNAWPNRTDSRALHHVQDGAEALEFLNGSGRHDGAPRPDLILLDLNLPRKTGREVLAEIKANEHWRCIPVVVLTQSQSEADILSVYNLNANCYVPKPPDLDQFQQVIRSIEEFWLTVAKLPSE